MRYPEKILGLLPILTKFCLELRMTWNTVFLCIFCPSLCMIHIILHSCLFFSRKLGNIWLLSSSFEAATSLFYRGPVWKLQSPTLSKKFTCSSTVGWFNFFVMGQKFKKSICTHPFVDRVGTHFLYVIKVVLFDSIKKSFQLPVVAVLHQIQSSIKGEHFL